MHAYKLYVQTQAHVGAYIHTYIQIYPHKIYIRVYVYIYMHVDSKHRKHTGACSLTLWACQA